MEVVTSKNKSIKKLRLITSFLIITLSIVLLVYAMIRNESILLLIIIIFIVKILDLIFNFYKIRRKKT